MTRQFSVAVIGLFLSVAFISQLSGCTSGESKPTPAEHGEGPSDKGQPSTADRITRGHYLVSITGCNDCHTPKVYTPQGTYNDSTRLLSGHPAGGVFPPVDPRSYKLGYWMLFSRDFTTSVGDWGINYSANLTPDTATGIGAWTENDFLNTIRTGKHLGQSGGRQLLPPMPWSKFAKMTDEDLKSIFAYLQALPPIHNQVPAHVPPPADISKK